jgi:FAD/FMN-containing dehydrogenase
MNEAALIPTDKLADIVGARHVLTGAQAAPFGKDWMGGYIAQPAAVVRPKSTQEVSAVLRLAHQTATPVVPIGGNTGLVGGTYAPDALMLSLERMKTIREIRPESRIAIVEAGVVLSTLHAAAQDKGLTFPLFFGARGSAMIGGNLSTNAGGSNVLRYGNTRALCLGLEVVLADGRILNLMSELHKDNTGYDLKDLFIGAEGTLGVITAAVLKLVPQARAHATAMVAATSLAAALTLLNRLQEATGGMVEAFEFMPRSYLDRLAVVMPDLKPPLGYDQDVTILVELGASAARDAQPDDDGAVPLVSLLESTLMEMIEGGLASDAYVARSDRDRLNMWSMREAAAKLAFGLQPYVDADVSVPLNRVQAFLDTAHARLAELDKYATTVTVAHLGDGNLHFTVHPSHDDSGHFAAIRAMIDKVALGLGGSFSAEHGIGLSKRNSMAQGKDPVALAAMQAIKAALDPKGIMNPGKVLP